MSVSNTVLHFDYRKRMWRDLTMGGIEVSRVSVMRRDLHYFRVQMFNANHYDNVKLDTDGSITHPSGNDAYTLPSIADQTNIITGIKATAPAETDDYEAVFSGYTTDSDWDTSAYGAFTTAILLPSTVAADDDHLLEFELRNSTNQRFTLPQLRLEVVQDVATGSEATAPTGLSLASGTASITAPADYTDVAYTGMTATGIVICQLLNATEITTLTVTPGTNTFRITAGAVPSTTWSIGYYIVKTS